MHSEIFDTINSCKNILLHCHPHPDADSVGSVLATTIMLEKLGKNVTAIAGDSEIPGKFKNFPNIDWLQNKSYTQVDINDFDLFIALDSSSLGQISQLSNVSFPKGLTVVVIDHHSTNTHFGHINYLDSKSSSTCEILFNLFSSWGVDINPEMALCLFAGIFADTGGFKHLNCSPETIRIASNLAKRNPNYHQLIFDLENSKDPQDLELTGLALSSIEKHFSNKVAITAVSYSEMKAHNISKQKATKALVGDTLRSVIGWDIVASLVEAEPNTVIVSLRTRDEEKFDLGKIAKSVGSNGGGHRGAAGTTIHLAIAEAKSDLLKTIARLYPELGTI